MRITLLGRFSVRRSGEEVPPAAFGGRLVRTLVRVLLTRRGEQVPKDVLIEGLWGHTPPADPVRNLEILVVRARRALGDPSLIETGAGAYAFARAPSCEVDAERFTDLAEEGRRQLSAGRPAAALAAFRDALEHWGGEPLPEDAYAEWSQEPRRELARRHLDALEGAATAALATGDHRVAVMHAERAVAREPLREASNLLLAQALASSEDQVAALNVLRSFRDRLGEELGLDPSPEAEDLQVQILRGEPVAPLRFAATTRSMATLPGESPFVGRDEELIVVLETAEEGSPHATLVKGHAGSGKSRLLAEAAARSAVPVLAVRGFLSEREEAWSLGRSLLREALSLDAAAVRAPGDHNARALAHVLPEVEELRKISRLPIDPESRMALALEGAVSMVEASGAGLVLADDAQWADPTSLTLLWRVAERTGAGVVLAYRPEEAGPDSVLTETLDLLRRRGCREITLAPLGPEAVGKLIGQPDLARILIDETDGTPLALMEVLDALAREGMIAMAVDRRWRVRDERAIHWAREAARGGQRTAIRQRASRLPTPVRQELNRLALIGREVTAGFLARAGGQDQRGTLEALDALVRAGLARLGEAGWEVSHDVVAETIAATLEPEERARVHAILADALRAESADPAEVARHLAGAGDPVGAARAYEDAAHAALSRFANEEAARLADLGLALDPDETSAVALLRTRGEARARLGELAGGEADLRLALQGTPKGPAWSRTMAELAWLVAGERSYAEGRELAEAAIAAAGPDQAARAHALATAGRIDMNLGDLARCRARSNDALDIFERLGDAEGIARVVDVQAISTFEEGRLREAVALFERAATLFSSRGDLFRGVMPLATRSRALSLMDRHDEGLVDADRALGLARMLAYPEGECYALLQRTFPLVGLGRAEEAVASADRAVALAEDLGHREWLSAAKSARATGHQAAGELEAAEQDFRSALDLAEGMPIHETVAAAGIATLLVAVGRPGEALPLADRAIKASERNQGAHNLALAAQAEVAAALGDPHALDLASEALAEAEAVGHHVTIPRLRALAGQPPESSPSV